MSGRAPLFAPGLWVTAVLLLLWGGDAAAAEVRVPLTVPYITLAEALKAELYNGAANRAELWQASDCEYLYAENPRFSRQGDLLRLETDSNLNVGTLAGANCINAISWQGVIEALAVPYVTADWKLRFHVTDLNLYNRQHEKTVLASRGFDLIKGYFVPRLEQFSFDLKTPMTQLSQLIENGALDEYRAQVRLALASVAAVPPTTASDRGLRITLRMTLPRGLKAPMIAPRAQALTPADIAAWQSALDNWDAFMVFAVKQLAGSTPNPDFREDLLDLLLDSRQRLLLALQQPQRGGPDPVRLWFVDTWSRFDRTIQRAAGQGLLGNRTLEFLSFISAGDALFAFDQAAPALGMRVSAADLRALAHIMAPHLTTDPLTFTFDEDPELQKLFGIRPPADTPGSLPDNDSAPAGSAPSAAPLPGGGSPPGAGASMDFFARLAAWITPPAMAAMQVVIIDSEIRAVAKNLRRTVPEPENLDRYRADIGQLLDLSASREVDDDYLEVQYGAITRRLVRSTAWQESCWRQFVVKGRRITYLESSSKDLGLMQVNRYVWRGFYSIPRLEWDIAYNAGAGAQILLRRLRDCARNAAGHGVAATSGELARSAYSAYNGGPASCNRWSHPDAASGSSLIDVSFWLKYEALEQGDPLDLLQCAAQWNHVAGH